MAKPKRPPASNGNADDIEAAFYEALQSGDIEKLMACWGDEDDIKPTLAITAPAAGPVRTTFTAT